MNSSEKCQTHPMQYSRPIIRKNNCCLLIALSVSPFRANRKHHGGIPALSDSVKLGQCSMPRYGCAITPIYWGISPSAGLFTEHPVLPRAMGVGYHKVPHSLSGHDKVCTKQKAFRKFDNLRPLFAEIGCRVAIVSVLAIEVAYTKPI